MKKGLICEGWLCHKEELLLHLRDRQDGRHLLGDRIRVLQDWEELKEGQSGDTGRSRYLSSRLLQDIFCCSYQRSLHIKHQEDSVVLEVFLCISVLSP